MIEKAREAALRAMEIDETLAEPHVSLAFIAYDYDWNWEAAEKEYRRAIDLNPNYPTAHHWFAYLLQNIGRNDEAVAEINRARELDPLSPSIARDVAEILQNARRYDEAIEQLRKRVELDETDIRSRRMLAGLLRQVGRYQESIEETLKIIDKTNRAPEGLMELAITYLKAGRRAEAQKLIGEAKRRGQKEFPLEFYASFCNNDKIFEWIEEKYNNRDGLITNLKVNPVFDCIRSDPRYAEMTRRLGLP
jgi:tetratricopeptide (TPR) repeat protein